MGAMEHACTVSCFVFLVAGREKKKGHFFAVCFAVTDQLFFGVENVDFFVSLVELGSKPNMCDSLVELLSECL